MADWKETVLWKLLSNKSSDEAGTVRTMLEQCMPKIQDILASGGTSPNDFTLHDAGHSFNVAKRMVEITPQEVQEQLSTYELSLLLLSAYLHDIGMTPERQKVRQHYTYLLTGEPQGLTEAEQNEFQAWLDDEGDGIVPPMTDRSPTGETLRRAEEIITYYCRHKHNDWSGEWIEEHREWFKLGTYASFTDDLIRLCKSHHHGYKELVLDKFNPRNVGTTVHLRYLAVLLRMADILEFDPERTPKVVLRHRDIAPCSLIYWYKDHQVSITQEGNRLVAFARPREARMHRAIELMLDDIEKELRVCRTLADETHFENAPGILEKLPYHWDLSGTLHRENVKPIDDSYEYINGAFRPDTQKILELLSGVELYGSPLVAVRELLQNAFDAVREQIAYQRLELPDPNDTARVSAIETLCEVALRLEKSGEDYCLVCTDNGVGMTKEIINRYLLVSGASRRHDILDLERRCKDKGFTLGRTGQFGIGVLSYFMLADKLEIRTRRSQEASGDEQTGWRFTTEGIGSFGELRRDPSARRGTQLRLHLKHEVLGDDPARWYAELRKYIAETLCYLPCRFQLETNIPDCKPFSSPPGWPDIREKLINLVTSTVPIKDPTGGDSDLVPTSLLHQRNEREQEWELIRQEARQCLDFYITKGDLPDGLGCYRLHIPFFHLPGGVALGYLRLVDVAGTLQFVKPELGHFFIWKGRVQASWKGMHIKDLRDNIVLQTTEDEETDPFADDLTPLGRLHTSHVLIEVDWHSSQTGHLVTNRDVLIIGDKTRECVQWLEKQALQTLREFISLHNGSLFASFNRYYVPTDVLPSEPMYWLTKVFNGEQPSVCWQRVEFPVTSYLSHVNHYVRLANCRVAGTSVQDMRPMRNIESISY